MGLFHTGQREEEEVIGSNQREARRREKRQNKARLSKWVAHLETEWFVMNGKK